MRLALGLAVLGVLLGVLAAISFFDRPSDVGDPVAVSESLAPSSTQETSTTVVASTTSTTVRAPLWTSNDVSLLSDVSASGGAMPSRLRINDLGIDAPIGPYGVDANGQMDVPDNVTEVGWYEHGPSPGEPGSAVLAAHVDLAGPGRGLFFDLDELDIDAVVDVEYDDGISRSFVVVARSTYLKNELPLDVIFSRQGDPVLTLVTCGGGFSSSARSYDSNVVVYAVPIESTSDSGAVPLAEEG